MVKSINMVLDDTDYFFLQKLKIEADMGWRKFLLAMAKLWQDAHPSEDTED